MPAQPRLRDIAHIMARDGAMTFGGGAPTTIALEAAIVHRDRFLPPHRFRLGYALSRLTPGTNLLAFCTALGYQMRGVSGAIVALVSASFPCSAVTVAITILLEKGEGSRAVAYAIAAAAAITIGLIAASCWPLVRPHVRKRSWLRAALLVGVAMVLDAMGVPPIRVLLGAALAGALWREPA